MEVDDEILSPIEQFYKDKTIFITGATGFIGKVLLEKLLRCCPDIAHIYLLIREKKGKTVNERLDILFNSKLFDLVKNGNPLYREKVSVIYGDLEKKELGISASDINEIKTNVNIIFHAAAKVQWRGPLKIFMQVHVVATKFLLDMAKIFKKIEVFIHVSTMAVDIGKEFIISERVTKTDISPAKLIDALEWMNDELLARFQESIEKKYTTMYVFTKALAENIMKENHGNISTAIVRPPLVMGTLKEPFPGWCDSIQSFEGLGLAIGKGVYRHLYFPTEDVKCIAVPVDVLVNTIIATAWYLKRPNAEPFLVVNSAIKDEQLPFVIKDLGKLADVMIKKYPFVNMYRHPSFTIHKSYFWYRLCTFFDHDIPAVLVDFLAYIITNKTFLVRLYGKMNFMVTVLLRLGEKTRISSLENSKLIQSAMSKKDAEVFVVHVEDFDWWNFADKMIVEGRTILGKEDYSSLPYARKKAKIWLICTTMMKWFIILYFGQLLYSKL